ncbi:hypothetical protein ACFVWY_11275 [Streptomyces sp. NPDC058195]|uniref:hypothetical protein n=1 Tax=Streptomyces sp. NPDC058195 TaxID=3346375 RepID=UPI0036E98810
MRGRRRAVRCALGRPARAVREGHIEAALAQGLLGDVAVLGDDLLAVATERVAELTAGAAVSSGRVARVAGALGAG